MTNKSVIQHQKKRKKKKIMLKLEKKEKSYLLVHLKVLKKKQLKL